MLRYIAIIPARMGSSRFPGKPMALINGMPMIGHVYCRTRLCETLSDAYVATCDQEIFDYIQSIGGKAVMTSDCHERCSDRTAEAMLTIEKRSGFRSDVVVMVQGDEPMVTPEMVQLAVAPMESDHNIHVVNLMSEIKSIEEFEDPNEVKVVVDSENFAIYFSREPIPSRKKGVDHVPMRKQVCIIPFRRDYLLQFNAMKPTPLEKIESVDMMRIIENGQRVKMVFFEGVTKSVDTPEDLVEAEKMMRGDPLAARYFY